MPRVLILALLICYQPVVVAQSPVAAVRPQNKDNNTTVAQQPSATPVSPITNQERSRDIAINIQASRAQPTAGSNFSLSATINNLGTKPITFTGKRATLFIPPEVSGSEDASSCTWFGYFTTEAGAPGFNYDFPITIEPGDTYAVEWTLGTSQKAEQGMGVIPSLTQKIRSKMSLVLFPPGDYTATATLRYHIEGDPNDLLRSTTQSALVHIAAPGWVILFGAAVGGLLGYFVTLIFFSNQPKREPVGAPGKKWEKFGRGAVKLSKIAAGAIGSILLSIIVTILLSRLSETQFLIRVSINDFWGAIAIGFVANLTGIKILDKIVPGRSRPDDNEHEATGNKPIDNGRQK